MPLPAHNPVATRPHDIRTRIPLTKFTNPADFPMHVHREFPKMLLRTNPDAKARQKIIPFVNETDQPILVMDQVDMDEFLATLDEELAEDIVKCTPKSVADRAEEENAAIMDLISKNEALQKRLDAAEARATAAETKTTKAPVKEIETKTISKAAPKEPTKAPGKAGAKDKSVPANLKAK